MPMSSAPRAASAPPAELPRVLVLTTGGTIVAAGYPGEREIAADELLRSVPGLADAGGVARVTAEAPCAVGSSDFTPELLLRLAGRVREAFAADPGLAGVVLTQGTDAIEETAFFFDLVLAEERPLVVTGAMRLPTDPAADGPRNLRNAVRLAACPAARGLGVLVTMNDEIHAAREVRKVHAIAVDAFASPAGGPIGCIDDGEIYLARQPLCRVTIDTAAVEPRVELVVAAVGSDGRQVRDAVAAGVQGLVVELFGRGHAPSPLRAALVEARERGVVVALTSRTGGGRVEVSAEERRLGFVSGEDLDGLKARMVLVAVLGRTRDPAVLQAYFDRLAGKVACNR
jgi:L-asparaginase